LDVVVASMDGNVSGLAEKWALDVTSVTKNGSG